MLIKYFSKNEGFILNYHNTGVLFPVFESNLRNHVIGIEQSMSD